MTVERKTLPEQHYLYVERETAMDGAAIAAAMGSGFGEVHGFVQAQNITPLAMPSAIYTAFPKDGKMTFRAAFFVGADDAAKAEGAVKAASIPAGDVATATHVGSYMTLSETHQKVWAHMDAEGWTKGALIWETYVDDPTLVPEAEVRTDVSRTIDD